MTMSETTYDTVPYNSNLFAQSQREQLLVVEKLFGDNLAPPSKAGIRQPGRSSRGNLIPGLYATSDLCKFPKSLFCSITNN